MNWDNFDRLTTHLTALRENAPEMFDYWQGYSLNDPGCVDCHCRILDGRAKFKGTKGCYIEMFLGVTHEEAHALWSPYTLLTSVPVVGKSPTDGITGVAGIDEALRRLAFVARRYTRPGEAPSVASAMSEATWLAALKQTLMDELMDEVIA